MRPPLYYLGKPGDGFGWGVCNTNMIAALGEFFELRKAQAWWSRFDAPVLTPIPHPDLTLNRRLTAPLVLGYCFIEAPIPREAERNALQFDWIFTGSEWNTKRLSDAGITHCSTLRQGVDHTRFHEMPWPEMSGFRVFSGGKFEFRKGQDYVIAAMRNFLPAHKDAVLLTNWHNPWRESYATMNKSWLVDWTQPMVDLPEGQVVNLPTVANADLPAVYQHSHVGLFPNRCEAGNNLVLCEYMACARPVIVTDATGHKDVLTNDGPLRLTRGDVDAAGWFNPHVSDIICLLERAYREREALPERGRRCRQQVEHLTWRSAAEQVFQRVQSLRSPPAS